MSRRVWIGLGIAAVVLVVLAGASVAGYFWWRENRIAHWHARAQEEFAKGEWYMARNYYVNYIIQRPRDTEALLNYAHAESRILENRETALSHAAVAYHQYLQVVPDDVEIQKKLLALYNRLESWADLESYAEFFLQTHPDDIDFLYYRARGIDANGKRAEAIEAYEDLIARGGHPREVYTRLALLLHERNRSQAEEFVARIAEERADDPQARLALADYYRQTRQHERAGQELEGARRLAPEDPEVLTALARHALETREPEQALEYANMALERDPGSANAAIYKAHAYALRQKMDEAIQALQAMSPDARVDNPQSLIFLAELLYSRLRLEEADAVVAEYTKAYPREAGWREYLAAHERLAKWEKDANPEDLAEAVEQLELLVQRRPNLQPAQYLLGVALLENGQRSRAQSVLRSYQRKNPTDQNVARILDYEFGSGMTSEEAEIQAEVLLKSDTARASDLVDAARALAAAPGSRNRPEDLKTLRALLEEAISRDPNLTRAYRALVDVLVLAGDTEGAKAVLARAEEAGLSSSDLRRAYASVALGENDLDAAWSRYEGMLAEADAANASVVAEWAGLFAERGHLDLAYRAIDEARRAFPVERHPSLAVEEAILASSWEDPTQALARIDRAATRASDSPALQPKLNQARLEVARRLLMEWEGDPVDQVRTQIERVRETEPDSPGAQALEAQLLLRQDPPDIPAARERLEQVLKQDEQNAVALLGLSEIAFRSGAVAQAREYARRAASTAPGSVPVTLQLARTLMASNEHLQAQAALDAVLEAQPDNVVAIRLYADSCIDSERWPQAEKCLEKLRALSEGDAEAETALAALQGKLLLARGEGDDAERVLRDRYEANPDNYDSLRALAASLVARGQLAEAEALYASFVERHPEEARALVDLARVQIEANTPEKLTEASNSLTRAMLILRDDPQAMREMIRLQARRQNVVDALTWCDRYLGVQPQDAQILYQKAVLLSSLPDRLDEALTCVEAAIGVAPEPAYRELRGLIRVAQKDYRGGIEDLQAASESRGTTTAQVDLALAEAYLATGQRERARTAYESAREKASQQPVDPLRLEDMARRLREEGST